MSAPTRDGVRKATGRAREEWFALLDGWGAAGREYREIADWLTGTQGLSNWWAQKLIVEYEQARGLRPPGIRPDGTFEVSASKTVAVSDATLVEAFLDPARRERWLPGSAMRQHGSDTGRSLRFDWEDGTSRVIVNVTAAGETKSQVVVLHQRLPDAGSAGEMKTYWRERLAALKTLLES
jgi:hypothetical protein